MKDGVRCYMTKEGALVCEKLEPGNYRLSTALSYLQISYKMRQLSTAHSSFVLLCRILTVATPNVLQECLLLCRLEAAAPTQHGESDAIACDPTRPEDCLTYCYVMEDGSMVSSSHQALSSDCISHALLAVASSHAGCKYSLCGLITF